MEKAKSTRVIKSVNLTWGTLNKYEEQREAKNLWRIRWTSSTGKRRHVSLWAKTEQEAIRLAEEARRTPLQKGQKFRPGMAKESPEEDPDRLKISDALLKPIALRPYRKETRRDCINFARHFMRWASEKGYQYWDELSGDDVALYEKCLWERGLKYNTVRLYLWPVRSAATWAAKKYQVHDIYAGHRIRSEEPNDLEYEAAESKVMSIGDVCDFALWLKAQNDPTIAAGVVLQGLCMLRLTEALRLLVHRLDLDNHLFTIAGRVKTKYSVRRRPMPQFAVEILQWAVAKVSTDAEDSRVLGRFTDQDAYGHALRNAMQEWDKARDDDLIKTVEPKNLRKTVPSAAISGGWDSKMIDLFMGHSPKSLKAKAYQKMNEAEWLVLYRKQVIDPIDSEIMVHEQARDKVIVLKSG